MSKTIKIIMLSLEWCTRDIIQGVEHDSCQYREIEGHSLMLLAYKYDHSALFSICFAPDHNF